MTDHQRVGLLIDACVMLVRELAQATGRSDADVLAHVAAAAKLTPGKSNTIVDVKVRRGRLYGEPHS